MFRILLALALLSVPALAGEKKVWRIDSLIATQQGGVVVVEAKGAVQTGGWKNAKLKLVKSDAHGATFEFIAAPPPPSMTVIDAVVPVTAKAELHTHAASVRASAEVNEVTTQVLR